MKFTPASIAFLILSTNFLFARPGTPCADTTLTGRQMEKAGMVNIVSIDTAIIVDLNYSTTENFLHQDVYGDLCSCYLVKEAAKKLARAEKILKKNHPNLSILVLDCARPRSVQRKMWEQVKEKPEKKYVANPGTGSNHNYGCAVDATIVDSNRIQLDMGTPFDFFGDLAQPRYEEKFLKEGSLSQSQIDNRRLLRGIMTKSGFHSIGTEWWHFDAFPRNEIKARFSIVE